MMLEKPQSAETESRTFPKGWRELLPHLIKVGDDLVDIAKRITYPAILASTILLNPHPMEAAEVAPGATYSEGLKILHKGALEDKVETAARYVLLPNGKSAWYSYEGEATKVSSTFKEIESNLSAILTRLDVAKGDEVNLREVHTHPIHTTERVGDMSAKAEDKKISAPPSIVYGRRNEKGDTSLSAMRDYYKYLIKPLEEKFEIRIKVSNYVVDPMGVWEFGEYVDDELNADYPELAADYKKTGAFLKELGKIEQAMHKEKFVVNRIQEVFSEGDIESWLKKLLRGLESDWSLINWLAYASALPEGQRSKRAKAAALASVISGGPLPDELAEALYSGTKYTTYPALRSELSLIPKIYEAASEDLAYLRGQWIQQSKDIKLDELMESDLYKDLLEAFAKTKIKISYTPF